MLSTGFAYSTWNKILLCPETKTKLVSCNDQYVGDILKPRYRVRFRFIDV